MSRQTFSPLLRAGVCAFLLLMGTALVPGLAHASPLTVVSFTVTPSHIDQGEYAFFNVTVSGGTPPYRYNWSGLPFGGLPPSEPTCTTANVSNLSCYPYEHGTFSVRVNVTDSTGQTIAAGPVVLTVAPMVFIISKATPQEGTVPLIVFFTLSEWEGTPPYTFTWDFGDGSEADVANTTHTYDRPGMYLAEGCGTDSIGFRWCNDWNIQAVAPLAVALTEQPANVTVLQGVYLNATSSGGLPAYGYVWSSLPIGCLPQNVSHLVCAATAPGTYVVQVTVTDSLGHTASATVTLQVSPLPPTPVSPSLIILVWTLVAVVAVLSVGLVALFLVVWQMRRPRTPE